MSRIKNQHYVPKFYLRNFCKKQEQIAVFDKVTQKSYYTSISNVANEKYFYDDEKLDEATQVNQFLEKYFHPLENRIAVLLKDLIGSFDKNEFNCLDQDSRIDLSLYLIYQFARTKEYREQLNQTIKTFTQTVADEFVKQQGGNPEEEQNGSYPTGRRTGLVREKRRREEKARDFIQAGIEGLSYAGRRKMGNEMGDRGNAGTSLLGAGKPRVRPREVSRLFPSVFLR